MIDESSSISSGTSGGSGSSSSGGRSGHRQRYTANESRAAVTAACKSPDAGRPVPWRCANWWLPSPDMRCAARDGL